MIQAERQEEKTMIIHSLSRSRALEMAQALGHIYTDIVFSSSQVWSMGHAVHASGPNLVAILEEIKGTAEHLSAHEE